MLTGSGGEGHILNSDDRPANAHVTAPVDLGDISIGVHSTGAFGRRGVRLPGEAGSDR
jgi:hypothetical protein